MSCLKHTFHSHLKETAGTGFQIQWDAAMRVRASNENHLIVPVFERQTNMNRLGYQGSVNDLHYDSFSKTGGQRWTPGLIQNRHCQDIGLLPIGTGRFLALPAGLGFDVFKKTAIHGLDQGGMNGIIFNDW